MTNIDKRLNEIEKILDANSDVSHSVFGNKISSRSDEVDLRELFSILWKGKWCIASFAFLLSVVGVLYALSLPNMYKSEGVYALAQKQRDSALVGQLGGLASLAGVDLGGGNSNVIDQVITVINSWPFLEKVINKHDLKPLVMGVVGWNRPKNELMWDDTIYDPVERKWLRVTSQGDVAEPSSYEVYKVFKEMLEVDYDAKAGMVNISVQYFSPAIAKVWVDILVDEVNSHFQVRDIQKAKKSVEYLKDRISETSISEMKAVFYGIIESQTKILMLSEVDERYLLEDIVLPKVTEVPSSPKRVLIVILFTFLGGMLAVLLVLVRGLFKSSKVD